MSSSMAAQESRNHLNEERSYLSPAKLRFPSSFPLGNFTLSLVQVAIHLPLFHNAVLNISLQCGFQIPYKILYYRFYSQRHFKNKQDLLAVGAISPNWITYKSRQSHAITEICNTQKYLPMVKRLKNSTISCRFFTESL